VIIFIFSRPNNPILKRLHLTGQIQISSLKYVRGAWASTKIDEKKRSNVQMEDL
jgi:hypothetical protein